MEQRKVIVSGGEKMIWYGGLKGGFQFSVFGDKD
jgi:hypothetical protein